jgi:hypothetical protein
MPLEVVVIRRDKQLVEWVLPVLVRDQALERVNRVCLVLG